MNQPGYYILGVLVEVFHLVHQNRDYLQNLGHDSPHRHYHDLQKGLVRLGFTVGALRGLDCAVGDVSTAFLHGIT